MDKNFSKRLINLRRENRLSQRDIAAKLGISQPSYTRYEKGTAEPTIANLIILADIFDVSLDYLLGRKEY